jgi:uncharacterized protein with HEPN domain
MNENRLDDYLNVVWDTVQTALPELLAQLREQGDKPCC